MLIFIWKLCQQALLTIDLLIQRNIMVPELCSLCGQCQESTTHLFLNCLFAKAIGFGSSLSIRLDTIHPQNIVH